MDGTQDAETAFSPGEIDTIKRALRVLRIDCCKAIDAIKATIGKEDPAYQTFAREYYEQIRLADEVLDRLQ